MECVRRKRDAHVAASNTRRKLGTQGTQNGASNYNDDGLDKIAHLEISARQDMFSDLPEEETVKIFRNKFKPTNLYRLKIGHGALGTFLNRTGAAENSEGWGARRRRYICSQSARSGASNVDQALLSKPSTPTPTKRRAWVRRGFNGKSGQKRGGWQSY